MCELVSVIRDQLERSLLVGILDGIAFADIVEDKVQPLIVRDVLPSTGPNEESEIA
jgi:hypothetical protein